MARLLLIGNSRWHWAEQDPDTRALRCWHTSPAAAFPEEGTALLAWAAVGAQPQPPPPASARRIRLEDVPLQGAPPWLGLDRALVGWRAWQQQGAAVLVADAGTALSLTRVNGEGCFSGGLISAGLALQLQALTGATAQLPPVDFAVAASCADAWPHQTQAAMAEGCRRAVAAAIVQAWKQLCSDDESPKAGLWLTGGDAALLLPLLQEQQLDPVMAPDLALEAMAALPVVG